MSCPVWRDRSHLFALARVRSAEWRQHTATRWMTLVLKLPYRPLWRVLCDSWIPLIITVKPSVESVVCSLVTRQDQTLCSRPRQTRKARTSLALESASHSTRAANDSGSTVSSYSICTIPNYSTSMNLRRRGGAVEAMVALKSEGLVDSIGVAGGDCELLMRFVDLEVFDVVLNHNQYTLLDRSADVLIDHCMAAGVGFLNAAPFSSGALARPGDVTARYQYRAQARETVDVISRLNALCVANDIQLPALALEFSTRDERISSTIVGVSRPERIAQLVEYDAAVDSRGALDSSGRVADRSPRCVMTTGKRVPSNWRQGATCSQPRPPKGDLRGGSHGRRDETKVNANRPSDETEWHRPESLTPYDPLNTRCAPRARPTNRTWR